jgi:LPXTG-motif cell wall-anchored protein
MKKLLAILICLMLCAMTVSATNIQRVEPIGLGQSKTVTIPQPTEPVDEGYVYFQQEFSFVPKTDGTYRMFISYVEDPEDPYDIFMDVSGPYLELENGIEFDAVAGEEMLVCFQYMTHDGRYPQFTFYLGTADETEIPQTGDMSLLPVALLLLTAVAGLSYLRRKEI